MHLFPPPLDLSVEEGFTQEKDIFDRKAFGEGLKNVLVASSDPLVLAVNGPWGTGKSVFLKMWSQELRSEKFSVIYFDAFEHDYMDDAFAALAGEIIRLASAAKPDTRKKVKSAAIGAGKVLLKVGANVGVKLATGGLLDVANLANVAKDIEEAVGKEADKAVEKLLSNREGEEAALRLFRDTLASLPKVLGDGTKPLVFIIDELDRCRPPFALALLERMKHFFAVQGVHFVLGVHLYQLEQSVKVMYGDGIDAAQYLQKFISLSVNLDPPLSDGHRNSAVKYVRYLVNRMEFRDDDRDTVSNCTQIIIELAKHQDFKLRTLEKIMSVLAVACAFTTKSHLRLPPILAGLCVMKIIAPGLFHMAQAGTLKYSDVNSWFDLAREPTDDDSWPPDYFVRWWRYALEDNPDPELVRMCSSALFNFSLRDRKRLVPVMATYIVDRFVRGDL